MGELVNLLMQRCDATIPWGFTVKLENGCGHTLKVNRVTPGTIASNYLKPGDVIVRLSKKVAKELANGDLDQVIKDAGNALEIIVQKRPPGTSGPTSPASPPSSIYGTPSYGPPPPPTRNPNYMSPNRASPNYPYPQTSGNTSPKPYSPPPTFPPAPSSPLPNSCPPPPPPMIQSPSSPGGQRAPGSPVPPPPPPPPPMPTGQTGASWKSKQQAQAQESQNSYPTPPKQQHQIRNPAAGPYDQYDNLPAALQNTLSKDKKPFTYTPGGIDLSELRSPRMQRRIQMNQMDPPARNVAKPAPVQQEQDIPIGPPPPETYPQTRVQLLPTIQPQKMAPVPNRMPVATANKGWNVHGQKMSPTGQDRPASPKVTPPERAPAYVHSLYNTPLGLYSTENVADAFQAQTGEVLPGYENLHVNKTQHQSQPQPQKQHQPQAQKQQQQQRNYGGEENFTPYYKEQHPQSRSFRLLQVMTDTTAGNAEENEPNGRSAQYEEDEMKFTGLRRNPIPSRAFQTLQKITGDEETSPSQPQTQPQPQPAREANSSGPEDCELRYRGAYIPSRSFKLLQSMTGGSEEELAATKTRSPKKTTTMNIQVGNGPASYNNSTPDTYYSQGPWIPPSEQQAEAEPKKYMGGHIPSRSFRMLQAMTGGDDTDSGSESIEIPVTHEKTNQQQEAQPRMYMGGHIPSRSFRLLQQMTDPNNAE